MDSNDVEYSTVPWDTAHANPHDDNHLSGAESSLHRSFLHSPGAMRSPFLPDSDEEDDHMPTSSAALTAEASAWADEPLHNDAIDINGTGGVNISSGIYNESTTTNYNFDNTSDGDDEVIQANQQRQRSQAAAGKDVRRDDKSLYENSMLRTAEQMMASLVPMEITVTDPTKEEDSYISYQVNTKTKMRGYSSESISVRRRYQDFRWLYNALSRVHPERVLPPLPDKYRLGYVRGDRFSREFVEKRRAGLERFLRKIVGHPILQKRPEVQAFLDSRDWSSEQAQQSRLLPEENRLESMGDVLMNAFSKLKKPDERFIAIKDEVDKMEEYLVQLEKIEQRILKRQEDLEVDYREFGGAITSLGNLETGITGPLHRFGHAVSNFSSIMRDLTTKEETEFLSELHECLAYCNSVKNVLKLRDQRQLDFEVLSDLRQQSVNERDRIMSNGRLGGSAGLGGFLQQKFDAIKGVDVQQAKNDKLKSVDEKIESLGEETSKSWDISQAFSNEALKEYEIFQLQKTKDLRQCLLDYTNGRLEFFEKGEELWSQIIPELEAIQVDD